MSEINPYEQPQAEVSKPGGDQDVVITGPAKVSVGDALGWIGEGMRMLSGSWGVVIGALVVTMLITMALQLVPFIGPIAQAFITPLLYAGIVQIFHRIETEKRADFADLFAGFSHQTGPLLLMVLAQLAVFLLVGGVVVALMFTVGGLSSAMSGGGVGLQVGPGLLFTGVLGLVALIVVSFLFYFVVPLIYLGKMGLLDAMKTSFATCLKNILPMLIYGLVLLLIVTVAAIPFMLGWLFVMPILAGAYYVSFRQLLTEQNV